MIWSTSSNLWRCISSSDHHAGDNPIQLLQWLEDPLARAQDLCVTGENLVKSLTCNNIELSFPEPDSVVPRKEAYPASLSAEEEIQPTPQVMPVPLENALTPISWSLGGIALLGLNAYFPQLSPCPLFGHLCQNSRLNLPARFQVSGVVTRNPIIQPLKDKLGS
ncbi:hypothetical protein DSO57_1024785 [Entomophthora muscae]|uniref:Uncharacterized protein n=1 Tax=Entomophthora muscae TaxID=34485 RepID=A0ACC2SF43_9FUNG|nr:hypothetical protein DSO57_1024785 [Entomophthora muscae]